MAAGYQARVGQPTCGLDGPDAAGSQPAAGQGERLRLGTAGIGAVGARGGHRPRARGGPPATGQRGGHRPGQRGATGRARGGPPATGRRGPVALEG
jgi:hypothetical protein